jgi:hypothetical protein
MSNAMAPTRQQASQLRRGNTEAGRPFQHPSLTTPTRPRPQSLHPVNEIQNLSPEDYLSQLHDLQPYVSVTLSPALERGESQAQDLSYLSTSGRSDFNWQVPYSSSPTTSDAGLTTASTATSAAMSRCNTNDLLCEPFNNISVESSTSQCDVSVTSDSTAVDAYKADDFVFHDSSFSSLEDVSVSQSQSSFLDTPSFVPFPSRTQMKRSHSQESNASSLSSSSQGSQSRMSRRVKEQNAQSKARTLAPKLECHEDSSSAKAKMPKIVEVTSSDGIIRHKAEIPRTTRQQPQRKTTFCTICSDHPQGFHGDHELRRHIDRHHAAYRRVWICKDNSANGGPRPAIPLANCKACRNHKTYGANYNAAAHLRRAHFYPCKNKRGGRGKISEGRGGMGGGEEPPMDQLKNWMYEEWDCNEAGMQSTVPEHSQIDADMIPDFDQFDETVPYTNLPFNIPQEQVQSCDWNNSQYGADLVSASYQFMNGTGGVVDQNLILASHHPQTFCTPYLPRRPHDQNDDDDDDDDNDPSVQI